MKPSVRRTLSTCICPSPSPSPHLASPRLTSPHLTSRPCRISKATSPPPSAATVVSLHSLLSAGWPLSALRIVATPSLSIVLQSQSFVPHAQATPFFRNNTLFQHTTPLQLPSSHSSRLPPSSLRDQNQPFRFHPIASQCRSLTNLALFQPSVCIRFHTRADEDIRQQWPCIHSPAASC